MIDMVEIEQEFPDRKIKDIEEIVRKLILSDPTWLSLPPQAEIAITAGSRGISHIVEILRTAVTTLRTLGLSPFLIPTMGSHGGGTAAGQIDVLHHLGITEAAVDAPIRSSMEVEYLGETSNGIPIYIDKYAHAAKGILVINRVKAHTAFRGQIESGLSKMIAIGLGKLKGATNIHSKGTLTMASNIEEIASFVLDRSPIVMGLAIIENGYEEISDIVAVGKENWMDQESELLQKAKSMMPGLPVSDIDLLIVEEMGKCFSGTGMDPNVIGRWRISGVAEPESPTIKKIAVLDLAEKSNGNAQGIGLADFTTQELVDKMDREATYTNALTSTYLQRAMLPLIYSTEREAIETAVRSLGPQIEMNNLRIVQISNTLHLQRLLVSRNLINQWSSSYPIILKAKRDLSFDKNNKLSFKLSHSN